MITMKHKGDFSKTQKFFNKMLGRGYLNELASYGNAGVNSLASATPKDTGKTAASWTFEIENGAEGPALNFYNTNVVDGHNVALLLQYGHGCGNGGYVRGHDFINPALKNVFDGVANAVWKEVTGK